MDEGVTRFEERGGGQPVAKKTRAAFGEEGGGEPAAKRPRAAADAAPFCTLKRLVEVKQVCPARVP